tara:strand:+ start:4777 stop:6207 length:1431 start_codon:yes stop_codon:yes gene_type:complete
MTQPRVIYNCQALYVGPAPETGYNFVDYKGGAPSNNHDNLIQQLNLLHSIDRIQSISYDIDVPHTNIAQINKRGLVDRPIVNSPTVKLNFDYFLCGTKNEARLGFNVNYPLFNYPFVGEAYYNDNLNVSLLSGFFNTTKEDRLKRAWQDFAVNQYKDCKNIYVAVNPSGNDIDKNYFKEDFTQADIYQGVDENAPSYHVISFGNCYLNSYSTQGSVGSFPKASVSYSAYNINFDMSGSGFLAPDINTKNGALNNNVDVVIPRVLAEEGYPALQPGDISLTTDSFSGLGVDFDSLHIQSYAINIDLNRKPLNNLGYRFPVGNEPTSPVFATLKIDGIVDDPNSGSLADLVQINSGYDFTIKVDPSSCTGSTVPPINAGAIPIERGDEALRYSFVGAKLDAFNYNTTIGNNKVFGASFSVELDPDNRGNGFFISGVLGAEKVEDFILLETGSAGGTDDGFYVQQETSDLFVTNLVPPY